MHDVHVLLVFVPFTCCLYFFPPHPHTHLYLPVFSTPLWCLPPPSAPQLCICAQANKKLAKKLRLERDALDQASMAGCAQGGPDAHVLMPNGCVDACVALGRSSRMLKRR